MVFGTFDIFHPGHRNFLQQAKKLSDYLTVVIARDKTVAITKKQKPINKEATRVKIIKDSQLADKVILGGIGDKYAVIKKYRPDIICLGYDQEYFIEGLKKKLDKFGLKNNIVRMKPYKPGIYKSSKLKRKIMIIQIKIKNRTVELILQKNKQVLDAHKFPNEFHLSEELLPEIGKLLKKNKLKPEDIKKITVKSDLGENFTTCRIAKAVANAWNWSKK